MDRDHPGWGARGPRDVSAPVHPPIYMFFMVVIVMPGSWRHGSHRHVWQGRGGSLIQTHLSSPRVFVIGAHRYISSLLLTTTLITHRADRTSPGPDPLTTGSMVTREEDEEKREREREIDRWRFHIHSRSPSPLNKEKMDTSPGRESVCVSGEEEQRVGWNGVEACLLHHAHPEWDLCQP